MGFLQFIPPHWRRTCDHPTPDEDEDKTVPQVRAPENSIHKGAVPSFLSAPPQTYSESTEWEIPSIDAFGTSPWVGLYYRHEFLLHYKHELLEQQMPFPPHDNL